MSVQSIRISEIVTDAGTQVRARINLALVAEYAEVMAEGVETFPPVVVFAGTEAIYLADGFHRVRAALKAGLTEIRAEVIPGTLKDAQAYAATANRTHGLNRTNEDKRRAVVLLMQLRPKASNRDIARDVGVSHTYVNTLREGVAGGNVSTLGPASEPVPEPVAAVEITHIEEEADYQPADAERVIETIERLPGVEIIAPATSIPGKPMSERWAALLAYEARMASGEVCQLCAQGPMSDEGTKRWKELLSYEEALKIPAGKRVNTTAAPPRIPPLPPATAPRLSLDGLANINSQRERYKGPQIKKGDEKRAEQHFGGESDEYERSEDSRASRFEDVAPRRPLVQHANGGGR